jgi:hypothetical protein
MNQLPKITATITIVETGETHEALFNDVIEMIDVIAGNVMLAELAYGRSIQVSHVDVEEDRDDAHFAYAFADTGATYMTVDAQRHFVQ